MTKIVQHVSNGVVINTFIVDGAATISGGVVSLPGGASMVAPGGGAYMMQDGAGMGWVLSNGTLAAPNAPVVTMTKPALAAYANAKQWTLATGGHNVTIQGTQLLFATDTTSMTLLTGKISRLSQASPPASVGWQFSNGQFVTISATDLTAAAISVADFIQATFDALRTVLTAVANGSTTTTAQIDSAAWPTP